MVSYDTWVLLVLLPAGSVMWAQIKQDMVIGRAQELGSEVYFHVTDVFWKPNMIHTLHKALEIQEWIRIQLESQQDHLEN